MSVWYAIPSKRPQSEAQALFNKWKDLGFKTAAFRDQGDSFIDVDFLKYGAYKGYPHAVNALCRDILHMDPETNIIVTGGDDYEPDPTVNVAREEAKFIEHFNGTFGVMQPTGDRFMIDEKNTCASERVCDAPWMGASFCKTMYQGNGPICEEYFHFFEDEELHEVAKLLGVLWHRPDIKQVHKHWSRIQSPRPAHLSEARLDWKTAKALFENRKVNNFPGHQPLAVA